MSTPTSESKEEKRLRKQEKKKEAKKRKRDSLEPSSTSVSSASKKVKRRSLVVDDAHDTHDTHDINTSNSPFEREKAIIMLSLTSSAMSNTPKAMHTSLQSMLLKYSDGLGGVLLSFDNIQVDTTKNGGRYGTILNEMPHIHYYVTCDVLVFNPREGKSLKGVVNETFPSHVGLLVHELFNAMIPAESLRESGFSFDGDLNEWSKDDTMTPVVVDDEIKFTVDKLHECNGLISLECRDPVIH